MTALLARICHANRRACRAAGVSDKFQLSDVALFIEETAESGVRKPRKRPGERPAATAARGAGEPAPLDGGASAHYS